MSTKQRVVWLGSIVIFALQASPCAAQVQVFYVRDAAGYVRPVVVHQPAVFSMGMQAQGIVVNNGMFVRLNVMPFGVSMPDPTTNIRILVPGPNLGIFNGGIRQPALISQQPLVLGIQGGTFGTGTFGAGTFGAFGAFGPPGFGGQSIWTSSFSQFQSGSFSLWP
jgi:hypothetical protein